MSESGCGVASAADVAPVARLAGVMQFLARAERMLGCDRQLVMPLANQAGLLYALNARLPPAVEPLAGWTRTGKVELSRCPTPALKVIPGYPGESRGTPRGGHREGGPPVGGTTGGQGGGMAVAPPVAGQSLCFNGAYYSTMLKWHLWVPLLPADGAERPCPLCGGQTFSATTPCHVRIRDLGICTSAHKPSSARSLSSPEFLMTASWTSPETDAAELTFCRRRGLGDGNSRWN